MIIKTFSSSVVCCLCVVAAVADESKSAWKIDSAADWQAAVGKSENVELKDGLVNPTAESATITSVVKRFEQKQSFESIVLKQSPTWQNWDAIPPVGPVNLSDAPVFLANGPNDYWIFGLYGSAKARQNKGFISQPVKLEGYDIPLMTSPFLHQFDAPGGLKPSLGGYHAWQSKDMVNWVHHGPVTEKVSRWVTTAEQVDGKTYIYYDYPNDQDPHLFIDDDLTDGLPGKNMGLAFKDPSDGSDCSFIRDLDGKFHVIYEDWTPINARKHSWDSPLAGHAVSEDGIKDFKILPPAVDLRTKPTGETATYNHPHWMQHPDWDSNVATYQVHEPEQDAFGDWAAISIGGQYYLFADYHPAGEKIRIGWFTSSGIDQPFSFCGEIGTGHPDPDIGFAEGKFYLINQTKHDYVSPGPWVESVHIRAGVDVDNDGKLDQWTDWTEVKERYDYIKGFSKQIQCDPAKLDLSSLPAAHGIGFEIRLKDTTENASKPVLDKIIVNLK